MSVEIKPYIVLTMTSLGFEYMGIDGIFGGFEKFSKDGFMYRVAVNNYKLARSVAPNTDKYEYIGSIDKWVEDFISKYK